MYERLLLAQAFRKEQKGKEEVVEIAKPGAPTCSYGHTRSCRHSACSKGDCTRSDSGDDTSQASFTPVHGKAAYNPSPSCKSNNASILSLAVVRDKSLQEFAQANPRRARLEAQSLTPKIVHKATSFVLPLRLSSPMNSAQLLANRHACAHGRPTLSHQHLHSSKALNQDVWFSTSITAVGAKVIPSIKAAMSVTRRLIEFGEISTLGARDPDGSLLGRSAAALNSLGRSLSFRKPFHFSIDRSALKRAEQEI